MLQNDTNAKLNKSLSGETGFPISAVGQDGELESISNGKGLGVRQHDDVMLSYGYSRKVTKKFSLNNGDYAVISLRVPDGLVHHAESRFVQAYNSSVNFKIVIGKVIGDLPAVVDTLPVFNQKYAVLDPSTQSIVEYRGTSATNPIGTVDENNTIDEIDIYATTGQGVRVSTADAFASVKGRYYDGVGSERIITALFQNIGSAQAEIIFIYDWHEFE